MSDDALFFFFNDTATTEIYTLSLHDALPISGVRRRLRPAIDPDNTEWLRRTHWLNRSPKSTWLGIIRSTTDTDSRDRKSTRLNSSHANISYAVFCLKKKIKI